ncbi:hypothetical protein GCM10022254_66890 [Actinomadura meridiana]|uniref:Cysteine-rich CPCC domain-containing protein n=1 Tax=Actinomadura meridiana TaxID=559626 RepID=A0ABP8CM54_9ACTN
MERFPCPCCGRRVHTQPPGSYEICPVCFWEDDNVQLRWPQLAGGANRLSLLESQQEFIEFGASRRKFIDLVRAPEESESVDPGWRPADPSKDNFEDLSSRLPWPLDRTRLYWWRKEFWRPGGDS